MSTTYDFNFLGNACSIVLRGSTQQILDEAERSLHDALCVLTTHIKNSKTVPGAGAAEMLMSNAVINESQKVGFFLILLFIFIYRFLVKNLLLLKRLDELCLNCQRLFATMPV